MNKKQCPVWLRTLAFMSASTKTCLNKNALICNEFPKSNLDLAFQFPVFFRPVYKKSDYELDL